MGDQHPQRRATSYRKRGKDQQERKAKRKEKLIERKGKIERIIL